MNDKEEVQKETPPPSITQVSNLSTPSSLVISKALFSNRLARPKKDVMDDEIFETFRRVQVNIPLLNAVKQIPRYAKSFKELCTNKQKENNQE